VGVGVWGWGTGPWAQPPNPQSPIPNPQSPKYKNIFLVLKNYNFLKLWDFIISNFN